MEVDLRGKSVLITRAAAQSAELATLLTELGARVLECPAIELEPIENSSVIDKTISKLSTYNWLLFTSANAVDYFMKRVVEKKASIPQVEIAVVGSATAEKLKQWKLTPSLTPERFNAEGLLDSLPSELNGTRILFPRAEVAREILPEELRRRGATVDVLPLYRTKKADSTVGIFRILRSESIDCIVFTSSSAVYAIAESGGEILQPTLRNIPIAVIGPVTRQACEELGLRVSIEPETATIPNLVQSIRDYFNRLLL